MGTIRRKNLTRAFPSAFVRRGEWRRAGTGRRQRTPERAIAQKTQKPKDKTAWPLRHPIFCHSRDAESCRTNVREKLRLRPAFVQSKRQSTTFDEWKSKRPITFFFFFFASKNMFGWLWRRDCQMGIFSYLRTLNVFCNSYGKRHTDIWSFSRVIRNKPFTVIYLLQINSARAHIAVYDTTKY